MTTPLPDGVAVRRARADDHDAIRPLARDFATSFTVEPEAFARVFAALLRERRALLLVATTTEGAVGYLLAHTHDAFLADGPIIWVEVMVATGHRGAGIGRALMNAAEQWAQGHGAAYVALASRRAGAFYLALGYSDSADQRGLRWCGQAQLVEFSKEEGRSSGVAKHSVNEHSPCIAVGRSTVRAAGRRIGVIGGRRGRSAAGFPLSAGPQLQRQRLRRSRHQARQRLLLQAGYLSR